MERGLKSVLNQTYTNTEIIVVDDGTAMNLLWDKAFWLIENDSVAYHWLFPRLPLKDKKANWLRGPARAANVALDLCEGDWIARNDDDDVWTPDHLEKLLDFALKHNLEFVYGATLQERYGREKKMTYQKGLPIGSIQASLYRSYLRCFKFNENCWRKSWNANNDIEMPMRMYRAGVRIGLLDEVVTIIRPRPGEKTIGLAAI